MIPLILALLLPPQATEHPLRSVTEPFEVFAPDEIVGTWNSFEALPSPRLDPAGIPIEATSSGSGARVDVMERQGRRWIWRSTYQYQRGLTIPPADVEQGVLMRTRGSSLYLWKEVKANALDSVQLSPFRNVSIEGAPPEATAVLYVPSESSPRSSPANGLFRFVPDESVLVCATTSFGSRCKAAGPADTRVLLPLTSGGDARVFRVEPQPEDLFTVLAKGTLPVSPKPVGASVVKVLTWVSVALQSETISWSNVVMDRSGRELALERVAGALLAPPPAFAQLASRHERGLVIRPFTGDPREAMSDAEAFLMVFPADGGELAMAVPLATALPGVDGSFHLPTLASGNYGLKLLSSRAGSERIVVSMTAGVPLDVTFPSGPMVRGRIVRATGGTPTEPVTISISADAPALEAMKASDFIDRLRATTADSDGNFHVVLGLPGRYLLRARWGAATAERTFVMDASSSERDLGDITLGVGVTLHGELYPCRDGEAIAVPIPNTTKAANFDLLRAPVGADGRFLIAGLSPGPWSVVLHCGGKSMRTEPPVIDVPQSGEMAIRFALAKP
jgi:hypothetical protein